MNCKLKLHRKGFYYQILGAITVLKFLQMLALDFPYICLQFFPGKFHRQMCKKFLKSGASACSLHFSSRIIRSEALVYDD